MKLSRESYYECVYDWRWKWCWGQSSCQFHRPSRVYARSSSVYKALEVRAGQNRSVSGQLLISERPRKESGDAKTLEQETSRFQSREITVPELLAALKVSLSCGYHSACGGAKSKLAFNIWKMLNLALSRNSRQYCFIPVKFCWVFYVGDKRCFQCHCY